MTALLQATSNGLLVGGVYCLIGVGMTLIFGVMRIINAAHGDLMMVAMYLTFFLFTATKLDPFVSIVVAAPALFALGCFLYRFLLTRLHDTNTENSLILTWGVSLILVNIFTLAFTGNYRSVVPSYSESSIHIKGISISVTEMVAFFVAIAMTILLYQFLLRSRLGRAIRAIAQNRTAAQLVGVNVDRAQMISFGLGSALAGVAGAAFSASFYVFPAVGGQFTVKAFEVIVLGGLGNVLGAMWAGLLLGLAESLGGLYISLDLKDAIGFIVFLLVLIIRPAGLFGRSRV